jgi:hypothetical protein
MLVCGKNTAGILLHSATGMDVDSDESCGGAGTGDECACGVCLVHGVHTGGQEAFSDHWIETIVSQPTSFALLKKWWPLRYL